MAVVTGITLRHIKMPLIKPYRLSYRTFDVFEPYLVEVHDDAGRRGYGDGHISPGSSAETRDGGWAHLVSLADAALGKSPAEAKALALARFEDSKVATTAFVTALEVLEASPLLEVPRDTSLPLLTPIGALEERDIQAEVAAALAQGFRTFKVKVGQDPEADATRVARIQRAAGRQATLRLDANRAFSRDDAIRFAKALVPVDIALFEQPCAAEDWAANAAVAAASPVPVMLDEPICALDDIERAAEIENVGFLKLKLKRFGSLERLLEGLERTRALGMAPVLGDGLGSELQAWLEACVAARTIDNAGEFNGFLKPNERLFRTPLPFAAGSIELPRGYRPELDWARVERLTARRRDFGDVAALEHATVGSPVHGA